MNILQHSANMISQALAKEESEYDLFAKFVSTTLIRMPERAQRLGMLKIQQVLYDTTESTENHEQCELYFQDL
jgi:hypothetical protein